MNNKLEEAKSIAFVRLDSAKRNKDLKITDQLIQEIVDKTFFYLKDYPLEHPFDKNKLFELLKAHTSIDKAQITIFSDNIEPWLNKAKSEITFNLWSRYRQYMLDKNPAFPINDLDDFTDKILDKCVDPRKKEAWDRRGMVVGYVQSGKTSNYVGLINKATDAGYKVIIVIAGTTSSLRKQTQERIDAGYVGKSTAKGLRSKENEIIGVGKTKYKNSNTLEISSLTSASYEGKDEGDFNQGIANRLSIPIGTNPTVFVIKKNKSILENLIDWFAKNAKCKVLDEYPRLLNVPALIIDDEADAASVNTSQDLEKPKTINRLIRTLCNLFSQKTFIGYTATPYANLFIPDKSDIVTTTTIKNRKYKIGADLFPKDFIINITPPSNYIGAANLFGCENSDTEKEKEPLNLFRAIDDYDPPFFKTINKKNKHILPTYLPKSLEEAIQAFILTCAIRKLRGDGHKHNSMLVHVAPWVDWIDKIASLVNEKMHQYKSEIASEDNDRLQALQDLYEKDFVPTTSSVKEHIAYEDPKIYLHTWEEVRVALKKTTPQIEVRAAHSKTKNLEYHNKEEIDYNLYKEGLSVIAVGGNKLSRGITLEGLSVSYYLRTTKMYDTLLQMSRWLGYRLGYVDLCRLYTTIQIYEWYNHITMATEELRRDFHEMTITYQRPKDFDLKVRNHPGLLTITSLTKLRLGKKIEVSFSDKNIQTYHFLKTKEAISNNFKAFENLIKVIGLPKNEDRIKTKAQKIKYLKYANQAIEPLCDFLHAFETDQPSINKETLTEYITRQEDNGLIKAWTICIVSNTDDKVVIDKEGSTPPKEREKNANAMTYVLEVGNETITLGCSVRNQHKKTRTSKHYIIRKNQIDDLKDRQVDLLSKNLTTNKAIKAQRAKEGKGLLLIYALDERGTPNVNNGIPIIGYSIHFPKIQGEKKVVYTARVREDFDKEPMESDE